MARVLRRVRVAFAAVLAADEGRREEAGWAARAASFLVLAGSLPRPAALRLGRAVRFSVRVGAATRLPVGFGDRADDDAARGAPAADLRGAPATLAEDFVRLMAHIITLR